MRDDPKTNLQKRSCPAPGQTVQQWKCCGIPTPRNTRAQARHDTTAEYRMCSHKSADTVGYCPVHAITPPFIATAHPLQLGYGAIRSSTTATSRLPPSTSFSGMYSSWNPSALTLTQTPDLADCRIGMIQKSSQCS